MESPSSSMTEPQESLEDHQTLWRLMSSSLLTLFNDLSKAGDELLIFMNSILNSKQLFSASLVPTPLATQELTNQYESFNKWLLGRLFYILSVEKLDRIHKVSLKAQIKILSILYYNNSIFYNDICNDYIKTCGNLIDYLKNLDNNEQPKIIELKMLVPNISRIQNTDINLIPLFVSITNTKMCENLIKYMLDISCHIMISSYDMHKNILIKEIVSQNLFVLENLNLDFKIISIRFFVKIFERFGLCIESTLINKFFLLIENLILNISTFTNEGSSSTHKQIGLLNNELAELMFLTKVHIKSFNELNSSIVLNICKFILNSEDSLSIDNSCENNPKSVELEVSRETYNSILRKRCAEVYELLFCDEIFLTEDVTKLKYFIKNSPMQFTSSILSQLKMSIYVKSDSQIVIGLTEKSPVAQKLISVLIFLLESTRCDDIHLFVIKEHLETCLNILDIIQCVNISFYSMYQQYCGFHELIFDIDNKKSYAHQHNSLQKNVYLKCMLWEQTSRIIENIKEVLKTIFKSEFNSIEEICLCRQICMKVLILTRDIYFKDFLMILQIECFGISGKSDFVENNAQPIFLAEKFYKNHKEYHVQSINILMIQSFLLNGILDTKNMKIKTLEILSTCDVNDPFIHSEILKCCPLLVFNEIISLNKCIEDYFLPVFSANNKNLYADLLSVLSNLICILYGHYCVLQPAFKDDCGEKMFSVDGIQLSIICFHCLQFNNGPCNKMQIKNDLEGTKIMIHLNRSKFSYDSNNDKTAELKKLFDHFSDFNFFNKVPLDISRKFVQTSLQHFMISPCIMKSVFVEENLIDMQQIINPFFSITLNSAQLDDTVKQDVLASFVNLLLNITKTSLENSNVEKQDVCLGIIRQFGMSKSKRVLLPSIKLLIFFLMHFDCPFGNKATLYLKDICESHEMSPNLTYHMYKKDFCRMIVDMTSFNYLAEKEFIPSVRKVVIAFEFVNYRDYISKEIHHVLPYLVPRAVQIEKLQNIILEISYLIPCTPAELLTDRFAHIYTHIYINESEPVAKKCYKYIEDMTGILLSKLIKKHARLILTELLIQYCCSPERVIQACKQLRNIDTDTKVSQVSAIPLTQVADYIQPKMLGVLANIDNKLIHTRIALSVKRKAFQSFPHIINLMGSKHITILRFKILATLRTSLSSMKDFPLLNIEAWNAFVRNVDTTSLGPLLTTIVVSLLPLIENIPEKLNEILEYLIVQNENILSTYISDLFFLEKTIVSDNINKIVHRHVLKNQPKPFVEKIKWYMQYLNHDTLEVKVYTLEYLLDLIKTGRHELDALIFDRNPTNTVISELLETLMIGCKSKDSNFSEWSSRCIGQLGALHPSLFPCELSLSIKDTRFAFTFMDVHFVKMALIELASACQFEKDTKLMDCYSLAIQDMLNMFKITPDGENKDVWESFPENLHQIMIPLLTSRYVLAYPITPLNAHPVYGSSFATTFSEWGYNWTGKLILQINQDDINKIFQAIHPALKKERTLVIFLPYIILHAILTNEEVNFIMEEIMKIIELESFYNESSNSNNLLKIMRCPNLVPAKSPVILEEGTHIKCCKIIYNLFDFFNRWLMEWCYISKKSTQDTSYIKINKFLKKFCKLTIARGNFLSGELERALQYLELYMEESPEQFQKQLGFLAEIYAILNESDSISGIMRLKENEPSLTESILAHEVTGQLQDAATCYEKYAQQGNIENDKIQGMVNVYLGLDQPFTALKLLHGIDDTEMEAFNAEPFWRLGMFDELDRLLERPDIAKNDSWGVTVGHCLLALRNGVRDCVQEKLNLARCALLRKLDRSSSYMSAEESVYSRAYSTAFSLHMLSEIEQVEDFIFKIKDLRDGDENCAAIINNLNTEWNLRLKLLQTSTSTFEPVLRLRRILLEQSKELLKNSHPSILSLLNAQIGKLWLHSAKFARKSGTYQQAYIYILNGEKYAPKELFIEKAKSYWMRNQQEQAFCTLKRGLDEHFSGNQPVSSTDRKLSAKAKLLIAIYNDETSNVDMDVNISYYQEAVQANRQWEKSLVFLAEYYEKVYTTLGNDEKKSSVGCTTRLKALEYYGRSLQYGHKRLYQSMPRMLTIWLDFEITSDYKTVSMNTLAQMCTMIEAFTERLSLFLFLTAFSQIISRICHPVKEVYIQLKSIIVKLILAYPQHSIWMMMCVINSSYPQRSKRCQDILNDPRLSDPAIQKFIVDFKFFAEKLIELCNKNLESNQTSYVSSVVRELPRMFQRQNFSQIMMPHEKFVKLSLPFTVANENNFDPFPSIVYVTGIEEQISVLPSLQKPRKVTLKGSDGKKYIIMLKPKDDLRKDFRLMEFNAVVNRYLQDNPESRERRLHIRTYTVLPLNEECGLIEWIPNLLGLRIILMNIYKTKGIFVSSSTLRKFMCKAKDPLAQKKKVYEEQLLPLHPPVFSEWFLYSFLDPHSWFQARTAYIRTTAVMSMVGYILGLGDRHGENVLFDSTNGDTVHVDFNCLFNKGEEWEYPERVPFRLTHNMLCAMGPLRHEGMFRKCCEITMHVLRAQTSTLMAIIRPFVYDPLVSWQKPATTRSENLPGERTNDSAKENLMQIENRLQGMVRTRGKQCTLSLSPEGQTNALIQEATSVINLCQMYIGWGPFL